MSALDIQVGGGHYKSLKIQPVEYIHANCIGFMEGNVIKYVTRWRDKNGIKDLEKAKHYIELLIEMESKAKSDDNSESKYYEKMGWIEWKGGECPIGENDSVEYMSSLGIIIGGIAKNVPWKDYGSIVRYRTFGKIKIDNDGWIEWHGGERPFDYDQMVAVKLSNGDVCEEFAGNFYWNWSLEDINANIIAYRVIKND